MLGFLFCRPDGLWQDYEKCEPDVEALIVKYELYVVNHESCFHTAFLELVTGGNQYVSHTWSLLPSVFLRESSHLHQRRSLTQHKRGSKILKKRE